MEFWGYEDDGELIGVMGIQPVQDVTLIRHAYVSPAAQGRGIGGALLGGAGGARYRPAARRDVGGRVVGDPVLRAARLRARSTIPPTLLRRYWSIPERQIETSVVLAKPPV